ncbi:MAG: biopolymer transporter ExbD [Candidatus Cloacimonetes bacterium]|nr:biopolymer transporter ExbD [Candidatus Cloacimonadota bacterium]
MKVTTTHKKISSSILISLTDVIFLLLIFLMLASNFVTHTGISVRLPGSKSGTQQSFQLIEVIYKSPNEIILNNELMDILQFQNTLPTYYVSPEQAVRLMADKETALQEVVSMMDIIRSSGFEKITIAAYKIP